MNIDYRGKTALITGASAGLGTEFAHQLAARGADLVLVARREDRLRTLAAEITARHGVRVETIPFDLARPDAGRALRALIDGPVHVVVNNAGFGLYGPFAEADAERVGAAITLNISALVDLSRAFVPGMLAGGGAIVNVASTAAYQPTPSMAVYGATKAFVLNFTEALAYELRRSPVKVLTLSPGATRTEFFDVVGSDNAAVGRMETPQKVVGVAMKALDRRSTPPSVISGVANKVAAAGARLSPRRVALAMSGRLLSA